MQTSKEVSEIPTGHLSTRQGQILEVNDQSLSDINRSEFDSIYVNGAEGTDPPNAHDIESIGEKPMEGNDPSLSTFETLLIHLFSRNQEYLPTDAIAQDIKSREKWGLTFSHNLLWKGDKLYIPNNLQLKRDILYWHHDVLWCGHLGIQKTLELVKESFGGHKFRRIFQLILRPAISAS